MLGEVFVSEGVAKKENYLQHPWEGYLHFALTS